jgi:hypothetical protein
MKPRPFVIRLGGSATPAASLVRIVNLSRFLCHNGRKPMSLPRMVTLPDLINLSEIEFIRLKR